MKKNILKIKELNKNFGKKEVLKNLNLSLSEGDLVYIYGENGCGKSTLFKLICDILKPDQGEIILSDEANLGALIENPAFLENQSMKDNLKFLADFKNNYDESRIQSLCNFFNLDFFDKSKISKYSIGMRQKVGIIQAFMENQNLILLDEPTRGLDKKSVESFYQMIKKAKEDGKCIIIAAHDSLDELDFDYKFLLDNGCLHQQ